MNSTLGLSDSGDPNLDSESPPDAAAKFPGKRFAAAILSGIVPGTGQLLLGHVRSGALLLAGFAASLSFFWPLRLPHRYLGFCVSVWVLPVLSIAAAWHAVRAAHETSPKLSTWWLVLVLPLGYLGADFDANRVMRLAGFQVFTIPSSAMQNTLIIGDRIVVDRRYYGTYRPQDGDVAVFRRENIWVVKRVMALEGETIAGRSGFVYRNNERLWEPYVIHQGRLGNPYMDNFGPVTISAGKIFVMGDNRDVSYDSRQPEFGQVYLSAESGKPLYIVWSPIHRRIGKPVQ